jgi:uncharacterized protein involved in exopolysaccharide biosynthesis
MTPEYTKRGLLTVLFRQKWKFLLVFLIVAGACGAYLYYAKVTYASSGELLIRFGSDADPNVKPENGIHLDMGSQEHHETIQSDVDIITSRDMLRALVNEFGPDRVYPPDPDEDTSDSTESPLERAVDKLQKKDVEVKPSAESDTITVKVYNVDPNLAAQMTRRLMDMFIERQSQIYNKPQTEFLSDEVKQAAQKLAAAQENLRAFKEQNGMSSLDDELQQLMKEKEDSRTLAQQSISAAESKLADLQSRRRDLLDTYRPDSTAVQNIDQSIKVAQAQLSAREADLKAAGDGAGATGDLVTPHIADVNRRIAELESQRTVYNNLTREVDLDEDAYKSFVTHAEEARIDQALAEQRITRVSIIDEPVVPTRPSRPRFKLVGALGVIAAIMAGLGTAFAFELMDDTFTDIRGVRAALDVPVFASFPRKKF